MKDRCGWWPRCECAKSLYVWGNAFRHGERFSLSWDREGLEAVADIVFVSLCCAAKRCPDDEGRRYAKRQLREPFWDDQKRRSMMEH
jgi:hypothetical protein